jgi:fatty acid desaturase
MTQTTARTTGWLDAIRAAARALIAASAPRPREPESNRTSLSARQHDDFGTLKREVRERGLLERGSAKYAWILARTFAIAALAWGTLALTRGSSLCWLAAPLLAFASGQLVLLAHDACHYAIFSRRAPNEWLGLIAINLLNGGSYTWWSASHNEHHARSNNRHADPDIDYPMLAFDRAQADAKHPRARWLLARQHWLVGPMLAGVALNLRVYSAARLLSARVQQRERVAFVLHWVAYPAALVALLGPWRAIAMLALHQALFGVYVGSITMANHWGMPMPDDTELGFVAHQVSTSRNVAGGALADLWFGGLNRQIEHHLFPSMPRVNLAIVRPIVQAHCEAHKIKYVERSFAQTYRDIYDVMRSVALYVRGETASQAEAP